MTATIPTWVPFLFVALAFIGYRLSLPRTVRPGKLLAIAVAMFGFSLFGLLGAFGLAPLALVLWLAGYAAAVVLGARHFSSGDLKAQDGQVRMPGSWVPLALLLGIFAAKFVLGFAQGTHSPMLQHTAFIGALSVVLGGLSGGFGARALAVQRCASSARVG